MLYKIQTTSSGNGERTMNAVCRFEKTCKNSNGPKSHQARMKCLENVDVSQHHISWKTGGGKPESTPQNSESLLGSNCRRCESGGHRPVWQQFGSSLMRMPIRCRVKWAADQRLQTMTTIIISMAKGRFGAEQKVWGRDQLRPLTQRAMKIQNICEALKSFKKQHKEATKDQRPPLAELRAVLRKRLMTLKRRSPRGSTTTG